MPAATHCGQSSSRSRWHRSRRWLPCRTADPASRTADRQRGGGDHVVAETVAANDFHRDEAQAFVAPRVRGLDSRHLTSERHRVVRVPRHAETQLDRPDDGGRSCPVGDVALHQPRVGEDIDKNILGSLGLRLVAVVMDVLIVTGRYRRGHDERRIAVQRKLRQLRSDRDRWCTHASGSHAYRVQAGPPAPSGKSIYVAWTGIPISTAGGSTPRSSPSIRTPSSSSTSAMTNGNVRPGTFGAW